MNIQEIPLDRIEVGKRLRPINHEYASQIALSFEAEGQMTPIEVRTPDANGMHRLVFGAHRHAAGLLLGWATIRAAIFAGSDAQAELRQVEENLGRRDLSLLDRARFIARAKELWNQEHPGLLGRRFSVAVRDGKTTITESFVSDVSEKLGINAIAVARAVTVAGELNKLSEVVQERLCNTVLANRPSVVRELLRAGLDEVRQAEILDVMLSGEEGAPRTVKAAVALLNNRLPEHLTRDERAFAKFEVMWKELRSERKGSFRSKVRARIEKAPAKDGASADTQ